MAKIENALTDLGIRLLSVASVHKHTLGQSLPAIGTMAGRSLAFQLPSYQKPRNLKEVFELAQLTFAPAWDLECQLEDDNLSILVGECFVRTLCQKEGIEIGGDLYSSARFNIECLMRYAIISQRSFSKEMELIMGVGT